MNAVNPMRLFIFSAVLATLGVPSAAVADVYKCKAADGTVTYQDSPCRAGSVESVVDVVEGRALSPDESAAMDKASEDLRQRDRELADRLERERLARLQHEAEEQARYAAPAVAPAVVYPESYGVWRGGLYFPPDYGAPTFPIRRRGYRDHGWQPPMYPPPGHGPSPGHDHHRPRQSLGGGSDRSHGGGSLDMRR